MSLVVRYLEGKKFEVTCRSHRIIIDQPKTAKGTDQGMSPVELFNAALASCAAFYAMTFLSHRNLDLTDLKVKCTWHYSEDPHRVGSINLTIIVPRSLSKREMRGIRRSVEHCTLKNTLEASPTLQIRILSTNV